MLFAPAQHRSAVSHVHAQGPTRVLFTTNALLVALVLILLAYYVLATNATIAAGYSTKQLNEQIGTLVDQHEALTAEYLKTSDIPQLESFAALNNLVPARDIQHLSEKGNVALR